jgi:hypothetical protein
MTTIDDARKRLEAAPKGGAYALIDGRLEYVGNAPVVSGEDLRTLLAHTADYDALKGRLEEAVRALRWNMDALEMTDAALRTWNSGKGSPANVDGALAAGRSFLDREKEAGSG